MGQFVLGNWNRSTYKETLMFIKENENNALGLYREFINSKEKELQIRERVINVLELKKLTFDDKLNSEQRSRTMQKLAELNKNKKDNCLLNVLKTLKKVDLIVGNSYSLNDDSSITIPWNWFEFEMNNG